MESINTANPLGYEKIPKLLKGFAMPSIIAMIVSSLYNIVDQMFIGQGVGYLGNAATNVAYPLTTICLAIALLIGVGGASRFSLRLGAGEKEKAAKVVGSAISMMFVFGILYAFLIEIFLVILLKAFGATTQVMPYAISYTRITALGMPLLVVINGMSNLARADGSPKYSMMCMLVGAIVNTILDPIFIFVFNNKSLGLIRQQQNDFFDKLHFGSSENNGYTVPSFYDIAKAYGLDAFEINNEEDLIASIKKADPTKPCLFEVFSDINSEAYPKTYFGEEMYNQKPYIPEEIMKKVLS